MMARPIAVASVSLLFTLLWSGPHDTTASATEASAQFSLPSSLEALYPPQAEGPVWYISMHGMNTGLTGVLVDAFEQDWTGAQANYEAFRARFEETSHLVPEWTQRFEIEPVDALGAAVQGRDPGAILGAVQAVGAVCHHCHLDAMVPVQQRFRWPDFKGINVQDPVLGADMPFPQFMQMVNLSLTGIAVDLQQGQPGNALQHVAALKARMTELEGSCEACHDTPRTYFVDQPIKDLIAKIESALNAPKPDPGAVAAAAQGIGEQSCLGCHLVHLPAAYSPYAAR